MYGYPSKYKKKGSTYPGDSGPPPVPDNVVDGADNIIDGADEVTD